MDQSDVVAFWPWYLQSARKDGAPVHPARRALSVLLTFGILVAWYFWTSRKDPFITNVMRQAAAEHPLCAMGVVLAFVLMAFRSTALDFLAYRVFATEHIQLRRYIFSSERRLHIEYERIFGKDAYHKLPGLLGAGSMAVFIISGLALVFSSR